MHQQPDNTHLVRRTPHQILQALDSGYNDRDDYPPFALDLLTDRNRYRDYLIRVLNDLAKRQ